MRAMSIKAGAEEDQPNPVARPTFHRICMHLPGPRSFPEAPSFIILGVMDTVTNTISGA
jgi:hypothetical protein